MPISDLLQTQTFRDWFNKTNEIIDTLNASTLANGVVATGVYVINPGSFQVVNTFFANSSVVIASGNTIFAANVVATANCNVWNFACGTLLIQPLNGTVVNTSMQFTTAAPVTFLGTVSANANVSITGDVSQTGNTLINGTFNSNNGPAIVRQVLMASANAMVVPAALTNPEYDDYSPAGIDGASVLSLNPSLDVVLTGIAAPTNFSVGARVLYIQNIGTTFNVTLVSANTASGTNNRFKFSADANTVIQPGGAFGLLWSSTNHEWRALAPSISSTPIFSTLTVNGAATVNGNVIVAGWINVAHQLVVSGNSALTGNVTVTGFINAASTLQVAGVTTLTGNATLSGFANIAGLLQQTGNATFSGYVNAASTLQVAGISTFSANVIMNGVRAFANGQLRCDTTNGRLVLPVGTNLYAT